MLSQKATEQLVELADSLDQKGYKEEANVLDEVIATSCKMKKKKAGMWDGPKFCPNCNQKTSHTMRKDEAGGEVEICERCGRVPDKGWN